MDLNIPINPEETVQEAVGTPRINIQSNIPIPARGNNRYPFASMAVGDSFGLPLRMEKTLRATASSYAKTTPGVKFTVRKSDDEVRVWRIE